jgi:ribonucleotide monophosphatase NagD (HAD superfamily)
MGEVELNVGSWVGMLNGHQCRLFILESLIFVFELSLRTMNLSTREIVVVGDRVSTDIAGAYILGLRSVLVKTGEFNPSDLNTNVHPDLIVDSIRDIPSILNSF